jgi:4'-phosphopantetheinyl transferase
MTALASGSLTHQEIHLWFVFCDEITDTALLDRYWQLLCADERAQQLCFHFPADRHRFLCTRALVRTVLAKYLPLSPEDLRFTRDEYGRPHIANPEPAVADVSFNISHTRDLVMVGVTSHSALGVDTENVFEQASYLELAEHYFSPTEASALRATPVASQRERFFHYWTLKESYIKALGHGLSIPLDRFSFHLHGDVVALEVSAELHDTHTWDCWLIAPSPDHVAAVCAQRIDAGCQKLLARKVVPLLTQEPLSYRELGRTHQLRGLGVRPR